MKKSKGKARGSGGEDAVESVRHQALKALNRVCKLVKGFLVLRCTRRLAETKKKDGCVDDCVKELQSIKEIDHAKMGSAVFESQSLAAADVLSRYFGDGAAGPLCPKVCKQFLQHKKLIETSVLWKSKIDATLLLPPPLPRAGKIRVDTGGTAKAMTIKPRVGMKERTKAVFLNSLEDDEAPAKRKRDVLSERGNPRAQSGRTPKQDLSPYMAPRDRVTASSSSTASSVGMRSRRTHVNEAAHSRPRFLPAPVAPSVPAPNAKVNNEKGANLHPSWIAKQQAKSKMIASAPIIMKDSNYSMRNKVYFDD